MSVLKLYFQIFKNSSMPIPLQRVQKETAPTDEMLPSVSAFKYKKKKSV